MKKERKQIYRKRRTTQTTKTTNRKKKMKKTTTRIFRIISPPVLLVLLGMLSKETRTAIIPFQNRTVPPLRPTLPRRQIKSGHAETDQHRTGSAPATMKADGDDAEHRETGNPPAIPNLVPLKKPKSNLPRHQSHASATPGNASSEPQAQGLSRSDRSASGAAATYSS
jgi:hypothetical protein